MFFQNQEIWFVFVSPLWRNWRARFAGLIYGLAEQLGERGSVDPNAKHDLLYKKVLQASLFDLIRWIWVLGLKMNIMNIEVKKWEFVALQLWENSMLACI